MKVFTLCLLHGEKCEFQRFKTILERTNHPMSLKLCAFSGTCSQKLLITLHKLIASGPCEKAPKCPYASEACKLSQNKGAKLPRRRYLFCLYGGAEK